MSLRTLFHIFLNRLKKFGRSERGMTLPLMAVSMIVITGMVGIAIDTARAQLVQSKLQFSLDAAGLAGGSTIDTSSLTAEVTKYMNANFNGYLGASITSLSATADSTNTVFTLSATATLPSTFMNVMNVPTLTVSANSKIDRAVSGLELVMVLDNTGSMVDDNKLVSLKSAATTLVNILYGGRSTVPNLWIGLVPFSQDVNTGTAHTSWMDATYDNTLVWPTGSPWAGCVEARQTNGMDITDDPPSQSSTTTLFHAYYNPCSNNYKWNAAGTSCIAGCTGSYQYWTGSTCVCNSGTHQTGGSSSNPTCTPYCTGAYQYWTGSTCACDGGTHQTGGSSSNPTCAPYCTGIYQTWGGSACVCASGSYQTGGTASNPVCSLHCTKANQSWNGSACVCNNGYTMSGSTCVPLNIQ